MDGWMDEEIDKWTIRRGLSIGIDMHISEEKMERVPFELRIVIISRWPCTGSTRVSRQTPALLVPRTLPSGHIRAVPQKSPPSAMQT